MNTDIRKLPFAEWPKTYAELTTMYLPRPIHNSSEYEKAASYADAMAGFELNSDQDDYLDMLANVISSYDARHCPKWPKSSGREMVGYMLQEHGLNGTDLARILNVSRTIAYRIMKGRRRLTADHIRALSAYFKVSADLFIGEEAPEEKRIYAAS